jgi:cytochrome c
MRVSIVLATIWTTGSLAYAGDPATGKVLFESKCAICHAADSSERRVGPALKGTKEGTLPSRKDSTHDAILKQIENGGGGMPVYRELLTKTQKEDLVAYVLTL